MAEIRTADEAYVQFHDDSWGVPVYNDKYDSARSFSFLSAACIIFILDKFPSKKEHFAFINILCFIICSKLFELLALSGMLIDHNWTEILKRRDIYM